MLQRCVAQKSSLRIVSCNITLWESGSGIQEIQNRGKSVFLGFGIRNTAQGIRNPTNDWNPESGIQVLLTKIAI